MPLRQSQRGATMRSAQGVYPNYEDDDTSVGFEDFVHTRGTAILQTTGEPWAPQVYVSLIERARAHIAKIGSIKMVFRPDSQAMVPGKATHVFPGFTIRFLTELSFTNSSRILEVLTRTDYQGQFHWHD